MPTAPGDDVRSGASGIQGLGTPLAPGGERDVRAAVYPPWLDTPPYPGELIRTRSFVTQQNAQGHSRFHAMVGMALHRTDVVRVTGL